MSVARIEEEIREAGAEIIWVLEADTSATPGTAASCAEFIGRESDQGWCVGDGETQPLAGEWDSSPFSVARGFDLIVSRREMRIEFTSNHGTPSGNENLDGEAILAAVQEVVARVR